MSTSHLQILLSVILVVVVVAVLVGALIVVRKGLESISGNLDTLGGALDTVESDHLLGLESSVLAINEQFDVILSALPGIAAKAAVVAERRPR